MSLYRNVIYDSAKKEFSLLGFLTLLDEEQFIS